MKTYDLGHPYTPMGTNWVPLIDLVQDEMKCEYPTLYHI